MLGKAVSWLMGNDGAPEKSGQPERKKPVVRKPASGPSVRAAEKNGPPRIKVSTSPATREARPRISVTPVSTKTEVQADPNEDNDEFLTAGVDDKNPRGIPVEEPGRELAPVDKKVENDFGLYGLEHAVTAGEVATPDDILRITNFDGEVLSGGAIPIPDAAKAICAYLSNGWFLVDREHALDPHVLTVKKNLTTKVRRVIKKELLVERSVIRGAYERHRRKFGNRTANQVITGVDTQEFQKFFLDIVAEASASRVSDIHLQVRQHEADLLFRKNGTMQKIAQREASWGHQICRTAFNMADASGPTYLVMEYQGARISNSRTSFANGVQSIRLQFNPLPNGGRYLVCRLLYETSGAATTSVEGLGYAPVQLRQLAHMRRQSEGINIISGPTGSGKSTTLVCILTAVLDENPGENIISIEDPPEYVIPRVAQLPVLSGSTAEQRREGFTQAINGSLRSDPDKIMIGEIRDAASAGLAYEAAMTGHGVYASLHANSAQGILTRLRDIKVEVYKLTDHTLMTGLIGQRLVRKLCPHCKMKWTSLSDSQLRENGVSDHVIEHTRMVLENRLDDVYIRNPAGCSKCDGGIAGRLAVAEIIVPDEKYMTFIRRESYTEADNYWLKELEGLRRSEHTMQKVFKGECAPSDAMAVGDLAHFDLTRRDIVFDTLI